MIPWIWSLGLKVNGLNFREQKYMPRDQIKWSTAETETRRISETNQPHISGSQTMEEFLSGYIPVLSPVQTTGTLMKPAEWFLKRKKIPSMKSNAGLRQISQFLKSCCFYWRYLCHQTHLNGAPFLTCPQLRSTEWQPGEGKKERNRWEEQIVQLELFVISLS